MRAGVLRELRLFFIALQFLTRVPVPRWVGFEPEWLQASARHFPAVGVLVGGLSAAVLAGAAWLFPLPVAVLLSMLASVLATGAFHEDGLADTCDALGGAVTRERALEIMKDSRIGTYGAVGLWMVLGLKAVVLATLPLALSVPALVLGHTASRAAAVVLMRWLPYAGDVAHAKAKPLAHRVSWGGLWVALGWVVAVAAGLWAVGAMGAGFMGLALGAAAGAAVFCGRWWRRRLGGITGDTLGATQQIAELSLLLAVLAGLRLHAWMAW
jgi:adenosylcobinamide-GDP ribazoletransferase